MNSTIKQWFSLKNKVFVHHMDTDGVCSVALALKHFKASTYTLKDPHLYPDFLRFLKKKKTDFLCFLDLPIDQEWTELLELKEKMPETNFAVLDHHIVSKDLNDFGIIHINPRFKEKEAYVPTSLMVFDLLESFGLDAEKNIWIAAIGTIADYGHVSNPGFMSRCRKLMPRLLEGDDMFKTRFGEASKTLYSAIVYKSVDGVRHIIDVMKKAKGLEDFESDKNLVLWRGKVDAEIARVMEIYEKEKVVEGDLIFFRLESSLSVTSIIANIITDKNQNKVTAIAKKDGDIWKISVRCPKLKHNLSEIIKRCVEGIGRGGGHEKAGGAAVRDIKKFRERLSKEINK